MDTAIVGNSHPKRTLISLSVLVTLSLVAAGIAFAGPAAAQTVTTEEVAPDGSTVEIETEGAASISITNIEGNVSNIEGGSKTDSGILFSNLGGLPETVSFDLSPPSGADTVSFDLGGDPVELNVSSYDINVITTEVATDGSTVTVETDGAASISVTNIEGEVSIVEYGSKTDSGLLFNNLGGLPETVSFVLTPPEGRDTVSFDVAGETIELNVTENNFEDEAFDSTQHSAVFGNDGDQSQDEISSGVNEWFTSEDNSVNGVQMSQDEISDLVNYWFNSA